MTPPRRAGCGKPACPVRCGGDRKRSDGAPYTGTKPETADTDKGHLHATAPVPDPTNKLFRGARLRLSDQEEAMFDRFELGIEFFEVLVAIDAAILER